MQRAIPAHLGTSQAVFGRPDVRRSCHPGAGGIMSARALAKLYGVLANPPLAERLALLSARTAASLSTCEADELDETIGKPIKKGRGFYVANPGVSGDYSAVMLSKHAGSFGHPGAGGSHAWADPSLGVGIALLKNRMTTGTPEQIEYLVAIRDAIYASIES
jgi:CubicO group peptidase (beta-lactamase class C family)